MIKIRAAIFSGFVLQVVVLLFGVSAILIMGIAECSARIYEYRDQSFGSAVEACASARALTERPQECNCSTSFVSLSELGNQWTCNVLMTRTEIPGIRVGFVDLPESLTGRIRDIPCNEGQLSTQSFATTIESINSFGEVVPAGSVPSPQCNGSRCIINKNPGGYLCTGYIDPTVGRVAGAPFYLECSGPSVINTGISCNAVGADQQGVANYAGDFPSGYEQDAGPAGGGGSGGLDAVDKANLQATADNTAAIAINTEATSSNVRSMSNALQNKLDIVAQNQVTGESNDESRHQEQKGILNGMLSALNSIDRKTGTGSSGSGSGIQCGGPNQPACNVSLGGTVVDGVIGAMPSDPVAEAPQGGLVSPGEGNLTDFKTALTNAAIRPAGTCPTWNLQLDYFNRNYVFDQHCGIFNDNRATLEAICLVVWSVGALAIVLKA